MAIDIQQIIKNIPLEEKHFRKGEYLIRQSQRNSRFTILTKGVARGFVLTETGDEINILFSKENDIVAGNLVPDMPAAINVQAVGPCTVLEGDFKVLHSPDLDKYYKLLIDAFHTKIQKRLVSLISLNAFDKYQFFLKEYPNLINQIPHYHVANYLGITPTQLSRIRKQFARISQQM
jgi:CRP/FNR family transcriptional regulator, anaerobic regulatory protein